MWLMRFLAHAFFTTPDVLNSSASSMTCSQAFLMRFLDGSSRSRDWWQSNRKEVHQKHSITPPFFTLTNSAERVIQYWYDILVFIGTFVLWIEFRLSVRCLPLWINFFLHACRISYPSLGLACLPHCRTSGQGGTQISGESCTRCHNVRPTRSKERRFPKC